jgi:ATP-dependent exoDNAse (exonuclease V) beta subunit
MTGPQLLFEEESHTYTLRREGYADIILPSVTEIMEPIHSKSYGNISERILDNAADRGTRLHRAIEFWNKYHFKNVDEDCAGYFDAYLKFREEHASWKPIHSEYRFYHKTFLYAGTCDLLLETPDGIVLLDIKTTAQAHLGLWSVQLAAYHNGLESYCHTLKIAVTKVLQVSNDGNYILHDVKENFSVFLACLQVYNFKEDT